jgi:hypothetical protein
MTHDTDHTPDPGRDSTVTDWHGQEVDRDVEAADEALRLVDGDEAVAEEIFNDIRPDHASDQFKVPADDREATLPGRDADRTTARDDD